METTRWDDVKEWFDPSQNGSALDVMVPDTAAAADDRVVLLAGSWR